MVKAHEYATRNLLRQIPRSQNDRTDSFSITYKKCEGEDIRQPFAHGVLPLEPERRVVSQCIVTFFVSFLPAGRVALWQFHADAHILPARVKNRKLQR